MHSVLFLILAFFNAAGLFLLMGAEFLAMILVVVYVGAVAVLFLFVVMMLDVDFAELRQGFLHYLPVGALIGVHPADRAGAGARRLDDRAATCGDARAADSADRPGAPTPRRSGACSTRDYVYLFQAAGLILLVAMIGAIVLTLRAQARRQAPGHRRADRARPGRPRSDDRARCRPGQGCRDLQGRR